MKTTLILINDDVQEPSGEHSRVQVIYLDPAPVSEVPGFCQRFVLFDQLIQPTETFFYSDGSRESKAK